VAKIAAGVMLGTEVRRFRVTERERERERERVSE